MVDRFVQWAFYIAMTLLGVVALIIAAGSTGWKPEVWLPFAYGAVITLVIAAMGERQKSVQEAMADLELREKVGVIEANALRAERNSDILWCLYVTSDVRAAIHLYKLAGAAQRLDVLIATEKAFTAMRNSGVIRALGADYLFCVQAGAKALLEDLERLRPFDKEKPAREAAVTAVANFVNVCDAEVTWRSRTPEAKRTLVAEGAKLAVTWHQFVRLFEPVVQVLFDWEKASRCDLDVQAEVIVDAKTVGSWYAPWYESGEVGDEYKGGRLPLTFDTLSTNPKLLPKYKRDKVRDIGLSFEVAPEVVLVCAYRTHEGTIVMDGNHRLLAWLQAVKQAPVLAYIATGPLDDQILADLKPFIERGGE